MKSLLTSHATQAIQDNLKSMIHSLQIQQTGCSLITNEIKTVHLPTAALWSFSPTEITKRYFGCCFWLLSLRRAEQVEVTE